VNNIGEDEYVNIFLEATAGEYMTRTVKTVTGDVSMRDLETKFAECGFNAFPVQENGDIVGLVSKLDFLRCFALTPSRMVPRYAELLAQTVADVMTPDFIYVDPTTKLTRVLQLMVDHRIKSVPVLDSGQQLKGIIAREDVMRALKKCADR
jgi:CBS domain-containing protein